MFRRRRKNCGKAFLSSLFPPTGPVQELFACATPAVEHEDCWGVSGHARERHPYHVPAGKAVYQHQSTVHPWTIGDASEANAIAVNAKRGNGMIRMSRRHVPQYGG